MVPRVVRFLPEKILADDMSYEVSRHEDVSA